MADSDLAGLAHLLWISSLAEAQADVAAAAAFARWFALRIQELFLQLKLRVSQLIKVFLVKEHLMKSICLLKTIEVRVLFAQVFFKYGILKLLKLFSCAYLPCALLRRILHRFSSLVGSSMLLLDGFVQSLLWLPTINILMSLLHRFVHVMKHKLLVNHKLYRVIAQLLGQQRRHQQYVREVLMVSLLSL